VLASTWSRGSAANITLTRSVPVEQLSDDHAQHAH
jgi:hypothetical protein